MVPPIFSVTAYILQADNSNLDPISTCEYLVRALVLLLIYLGVAMLAFKSHYNDIYKHNKRQGPLTS